ncbi:Tannase/feruloyl esterase [Aspergillus pseudoustus]|uniref:Carboxylic ester hydrolase n=1 Tax=Aspergillus pseudoustus TaxID=1810923 RepID=A0ABR4JBS1_9EURO
MPLTTHGVSALCFPSTFHPPTVVGAEITSIGTQLVTNFTSHVPDGAVANTPGVDAIDLAFCNVTVSYTHPGQGDNITVTAWLPIGTWNERMEGVGGGGWVAGGPNSLAYPELVIAVASGYAGVTTDAGLNVGVDTSARGWALLSRGNVNLYNLQNLASRSLHDQAIIGKSVITDFYGRPPKKSYWTGCSQGGRQGMMLAQRYPGLYDGIASAAPAINWNAFFSAMYWPQLFMNLAGEHPHNCELDAITAAAVSACDGIDGVLDGIISDVDACNFNPFSVVGTTFNCSETNTTREITQSAAAVANATWSGPRTMNGNAIWYGPHMGATLSGLLGLAATNCADDVCVGAPVYLGTEWIKLFIEKNPDFDLTRISHQQYDEIVHAGGQEFASTIDTTDADLSRFKDRGGKILTFHGLADPIIPPQGSEHYHDSVKALDSGVNDFYRLFLAPGVAHCSGGPGGHPYTVLDALVEWVENGKAPDTLPVSFTSATGMTYNRILCPYPSKALYSQGNDPTLAESFYCG